MSTQIATLKNMGESADQHKTPPIVRWRPTARVALQISAPAMRKPQAESFQAALAARAARLKNRHIPVTAAAERGIIFMVGGVESRHAQLSRPMR